HPPMERKGGDELHVVDAGRGGHVEDGLDHPLAIVRPAHRRQRQRDVVEGDRELHAGPQKRGQRFAVEGLEQRPADGLVGVGKGIESLGRVDDAAPHRQALEAEALAVPEQRGWCRSVDVEDESGPRHYDNPRSPRRSKATFTAPRAPALAACSMASRHRSNGYKALTRRPRPASWTRSKALAKSSAVYVYAPRTDTSRCHSGVRSTLTRPGIPARTIMPPGATTCMANASEASLPTQSMTVSTPQVSWSPATIELGTA